MGHGRQAWPLLAHKFYCEKAKREAARHTFWFAWSNLKLQNVCLPIFHFDVRSCADFLHGIRSCAGWMLFTIMFCYSKSFAFHCSLILRTNVVAKLPRWSYPGTWNICQGTFQTMTEVELRVRTVWVWYNRASNCPMVQFENLNFFT